MKKVFYSMALLATLSLASCGNKQNADDTAGVQDAVVVEESVTEVMADTAATPAENLEAAGENAEAALDETGDAVKGAADELKKKGEEGYDAAKEKGRAAVEAAKEKGRAAAANAKEKAADALQKGADKLRK